MGVAFLENESLIRNHPSLSHANRASTKNHLGLITLLTRHPERNEQKSRLVD